MQPVPTLTILYHPKLRRIGDRALLGELLWSEREVKLGRLMPSFMPPRQDHAKHLDEVHVSREPVRLRRAQDGGIDLFRDRSRTHVVLDGAELGEHAHVSPRQLQHGVLIELASRILLLLHEHTPPDVPEVGGDLGLVGESTAMVRVRADIRKVADSEATTLIRGQTGTGKELAAQAIHELSRRCRQPMVSINIGAITAELALAELFGARRGAYTSAAGDREGYFHRAHRSTLLLDEIGEASHDVQVALLRVLENKQLYRVGSKDPEPIDVRVLAATDAPLEHRIGEGRFSDALRYRLTGYEIEMPPLRERRDDIGRLLLHFLGLELTEIGEAERLDQIEPAPWLPMHVVARLVRHDWPGNVRELRQAVRQLVIANHGRAVAEMPPLLARRLDEASAAHGAPVMGPPDGGSPPSPEPRSRQPVGITDEEIVESLRRHDWKIEPTAEELGVSRTTLYKRMRASGLMRLAKDIDLDELRQARDECGGDLDDMANRLCVSRGGLVKRLKQLGLS